MIFREMVERFRERNRQSRDRIYRALQDEQNNEAALNEMQELIDRAEPLNQLQHEAPPLAIEGEPRETPLHDAVKNSDYSLVKELIDQGSDPNAKDSQGQTPLHKAVLRADLKMVEILKRTPVVKLDIRDNQKRFPRNLGSDVLGSINGEVAIRIGESLKKNSFLRRNSPIGSSTELKLLFEKRMNLNKILDKLNQPIIVHRNSKESLSIIIDKESQKSQNKDSTLKELTRVLEHHFESKTLEVGNSSNAKASKSNTPRI